ncbi:MAG: ATP-binding protein [Myxococcota bacterium]
MTPVSRGDATQLESALLNLAINGRDAMPGGGVLTISASERAITAADLAPGDEAAPGDYVVVSVADTGTGIAPEHLERIFEPLFTTKPDGAGTGLGLSMVYGFVRQSGGFIRVDTEPGRGTEIALYLPRADRPGEMQ